MRQRRSSKWRWGIVFFAWVGGCGSGAPRGPVARPLEPGDFVAQKPEELKITPEQAARRPGQAEKDSQDTRRGPAVDLSASDDEFRNDVPPVMPNGARRGGAYTVDAMVGQVNGQPIYAQRVIEPIEEQLAALGRSLPRREFALRARQLIDGRIGQIVADALILGEAERDLSDQEKAGLYQFLKNQREELIRLWGRGSVAVAEEKLMSQTGHGLEETLTETRQRMLVQRYLRQRLFPKINVTRKDVERYYEEHAELYNPPPHRVLRLIQVADAAAADEVDRRLEQGVSFEEVASSPRNQYRADQRGLMAEKAVGEHIFGQPELNEAVFRLKPGEHSRRVTVGDRFWWIKLESIEQPATRSLNQAQLEIEGVLRRQRFQALTQQYREELFATGSYNPLEQMSQALLGVAMSRFAAVEQ